MKLLAIVALFFLNSCTVNITMAHTEGQASDVVDASPSTSAQVDPNVNIPLK